MLRDTGRLRPLPALIAFLLACAAVTAAEGGRERTSRPGPLLAQADDPPVCCSIHRRFAVMSRSVCRSALGFEAPAARCRGPHDPAVCCALPKGFFTMSARACSSANGRIASPARCRESEGPRACCATANGFFTMSRRACGNAGGRPVPAVRCAAQALICCRLTDENGNETWRSATVRACRAEGGRIAEARFCRDGLRRLRPRGG